MKSIKTSRKSIERMGGIKAPESSIYTYKNLLYYLTSKEISESDVKSGCICEKSYKFIIELKEKTGYQYANYVTLFYASGLYGVIGRYDEITLYDGSYNEIDHFYLKFC